MVLCPGFVFYVGELEGLNANMTQSRADSERIRGELERQCDSLKKRCKHLESELVSRETRSSSISSDGTSTNGSEHEISSQSPSDSLRLAREVSIHFFLVWIYVCLFVFPSSEPLRSFVCSFLSSSFSGWGWKSGNPDSSAHSLCFIIFLQTFFIHSPFFFRLYTSDSRMSIRLCI